MVLELSKAGRNMAEEQSHPIGISRLGFNEVDTILLTQINAHVSLMPQNLVGMRLQFLRQEPRNVIQSSCGRCNVDIGARG
jgi:hypothetical protein